MTKVVKKKAEKPDQQAGSRKKSWQEKLHIDWEPKKEVTTKSAKIWLRNTMPSIPAPLQPAFL